VWEGERVSVWEGERVSVWEGECVRGRNAGSVDEGGKSGAGCASRSAVSAGRQVPDGRASIVKGFSPGSAPTHSRVMKSRMDGRA